VGDGELNGAQRRALEALRTDGIAVLAFDDLFEAGLLSQLQDDIVRFIGRSEEKARGLGDRPASKGAVIFRRFFMKSSGTVPEFGLDSPSLRIAASDELLGIVNAYLGSRTRLYYLDNWFTPAYPGASGRIASQRWHRDPEDEHVVKLFVYLSDVGEDAGPFEYVRSSTGGGKYGELWRWGQDDRWYPPPEELEAAVDPEDRLVLVGPAGTIVLADTAGFHRGGFARNVPRVMCVATYLQPDADGKYADPRLSVSADGRELSPAVRAALGLSS
jgi:hypothetical protein